ncbi:hypothetical protein NDU88_012634 [Pleurodeles waltl]|uniref:Uncharacterized protein n=1 Tax=Pleurodeles waltl TaxID=8319 RepID=A0AAV7R3T1_PLEWA|nr:hypothetical protein NDU88_012634 [Pleurodeles waltl]
MGVPWSSAVIGDLSRPTLELERVMHRDPGEDPREEGTGSTTIRPEPERLQTFARGCKRLSTHLRSACASWASPRLSPASWLLPETLQHITLRYEKFLTCNLLLHAMCSSPKHCSIKKGALVFVPLHSELGPALEMVLGAQEGLFPDDGNYGASAENDVR